MADVQELWPGGPVFAQAANFRLSTDSVLLADFIHTCGAVRGIDLGCGSGILALLLLWRTEKLHMTGLELDGEAAALAAENLERNGLTARSSVLTGDIRQYRALFKPGSFDLAAANPPYYAAGSGGISPDPARAAARGEVCCTLEELCATAAWLLPSGGRFCLVHKPERLSELLCTMTAQGLEPKRLRLVNHLAERAPSLVLVEGRRGSRPGLTVEPPLILADADGGESAEYRRIYHR
ncbi:MAG: methyltransferase [Oscillospiraceae bacterium]|nr:methyltransferase [Oscillospiraceae bacterium]